MLQQAVKEVMVAAHAYYLDLRDVGTAHPISISKNWNMPLRTGYAIPAPLTRAMAISKMGSYSSILTTRALILHESIKMKMQP